MNEIAQWPVSNVRGCSGSLSLSDKKRELLLPLLTHRTGRHLCTVSTEVCAALFIISSPHNKQKDVCVFSKLRSIKLKKKKRFKM